MITHRNVPNVVWLAATLLLVLCASCERAAEVETAQPAAVDDVEGAADVPSAEPTAPEMYALRFEPEAGARYAVTLWMEREIALLPGDPDDQSVADAPTPPREPAFEFTFDAEVDAGESGAAEDALDVRVTISAVTVHDRERVPAGLLAQAQRELAALVGVEGVWRYEGGALKESRFEVPGGVPPRGPAMLESIEVYLHRLSLPQPGEMVTAGGIWTVESDLAQRGMTVGRVHRFELLDAEDGTARVRLMQRQAAADEVMTLQGPMGDVIVNVHELTDNAEGVVIYELDSIPVGAGELTGLSTTTTSVDTPIGPQRQTASTQWLLRTTVRRAGPGDVGGGSEAVAEPGE